ncbi:MAG: hypothetical protein AAB834_02160, partial [Patescibacteria group bacterium]
SVLFGILGLYMVLADAGLFSYIGLRHALSLPRLAKSVGGAFDRGFVICHIGCIVTCRHSGTSSYSFLANRGMLDIDMSDTKSTKLNIRGDRPTALSSWAQGSNLDAIGFNIAFLAARNPKLAIEVMKLYALAHNVQENDPTVPDEDSALFADEVAKILANASADSL